MKKFPRKALAALAVACVAVCLLPAAAFAEEAADAQLQPGAATDTLEAQADSATGGTMLFRVYNPNSGEHFYTADADERNGLCGGKQHGWSYEGVGWVAPESGNPVYRMYNPIAGDHHYTVKEDERDSLVAAGWNYEGICWYSDTAETVPLYRDYNPNQFAWNHNYTADASEHNFLTGVGWQEEGVGWYGASAPSLLRFDDAIFRSTYVDTMTGKAPDAVPLNTLVTGMNEALSPDMMKELLVPAPEAIPPTNVACTYQYGTPKRGMTDYSIAKGVSGNSVTFFIWTSTKSGFLSVDLDANGMIQPDATANCYSFY